MKQSQDWSGRLLLAILQVLAISIIAMITNYLIGHYGPRYYSHRLLASSVLSALAITWVAANVADRLPWPRLIPWPIPAVFVTGWYGYMSHSLTGSWLIAGPVMVVSSLLVFWAHWIMQSEARDRPQTASGASQPPAEQPPTPTVTLAWESADASKDGERRLQVLIRWPKMIVWNTQLDPTRAERMAKRLAEALGVAFTDVELGPVEARFVCPRSMVFRGLTEFQRIVRHVVDRELELEIPEVPDEPGVLSD